MGYVTEFFVGIKLFHGEFEDEKEEEKLIELMKSPNTVQVAAGILDGKKIQYCEQTLKGLEYWLSCDNYSNFVWDEDMVYIYGTVKAFYDWDDWREFIGLLEDVHDYWFGAVAIGEQLDDNETWGDPWEYGIGITRSIQNPLGI